MDADELEAIDESGIKALKEDLNKPIPFSKAE